MDDRHTYMFEHELAKIWPTLTAAPEVKMDLTFTVTMTFPTYRATNLINVLLATRFSDKSIENGWVNLNPHLLGRSSLPKLWFV